MVKALTNTSVAYRAMLWDLLNNPEYISAPRGLPIHEITNYSIRILNPTSENIMTHDEERNKTIASYTQKEKELYDSGSLLVSDFSKASKFWEKLDNGDGTINSNYGYLVFHEESEGCSDYEFSMEPITYTIDGEEYDDLISVNYMRTPYEWAKQSLIKDKDTRQAIVRFNKPRHAWTGNKDFVCTMHGNFHIRDNRLNFSIVMRSNDVVKGTAYDWPYFISIQERMLQDLKPHYPELQMGYFEHFAHSLHFYTKDIEIVKRMLGQ